MAPSPVQSSLPAMFNTDELENTWQTILLYGPPGSGKTYSIKTLKPLNPFVLATEIGHSRGLQTLKGLGFSGTKIDTVEQMNLVLAELRAKAKPEGVYYNNAGPFGVVILDSGSHMSEIWFEKSKALKGWDMAWDSTPGRDPRGAYPYVAEKGRMQFKSIFALPCHTIVIAREAIHTVGEGKDAVDHIVPEFVGQQLNRSVPGWPEATVRIRMLNGKSVLITTTEERAACRVRLPDGWTIPSRVQPNLYALIRYMQGERAALEELKIPAAR